MSNNDTTIIAPASALGGGVSVLRVSGPLAKRTIIELSGTENPEPRFMVLAEFKNPKTNKTLDHGLAVYFAGPNSFTGEDVAEFHLHGGRAIMDGMLAALSGLDPSIRLAEGGEFTKRAYLNGKLDLTAAEAVADLVAAETEAQADLALAQMGGSLKTLYEDWRAQLLRTLAYMEAAIDFVDEEDVPDDVLRETNNAITSLLQSVGDHLNDASLGERLRDGFTVAVIGAPNAGKSSLVNALAKRDVAIVSDIAGTTRDAIEVHLNLGGYPVILIDTAGLRETTDTIESEGIARARKRAAHADIVLALFDATSEKDAETSKAVDDKTLVVLTKGDLVTTQQQDALMISVATGHNVDQLVKTLTEKIAALTTRKNNAPLLTRVRHREAVTEAQSHLQRALNNPQPELKAEDIRMATRALGRLTGRVDVEDLLDVIFRDFCIGK